MQLNLSGHHVEISQPLRNYVTEKLKKLERHTNKINSIQVILSIESVNHKAEGTIRINGAELFAKSESGDMYAAVDLLVDKLDRQLIANKEKSLAHKQNFR